MTVLVTGGAGFIGSHLTRLLAERGDAVRVLERPGARADHLRCGGVELVRADVRDRPAVTRAAAGCEVVYHLAANPQLWTRRKGHFRQVNSVGTQSVLTAAWAAGARRVVHVSTESILTRCRQSAAIAEDQVVPAGEVIGPYCRSKWLAERFAFQLSRAGAPVVVANPTLPVGPGDLGRSPPTQMLLDCCRGKRAFYLDAELNLVDVRDVARGLIRVADCGRVGCRYLLGGENWTIRRLFARLAQMTGSPPPRWPVPYPVALGVALVSEWLADVVTGTTPAASVTGVRLTRRTMRFDSSRSRAELGWTPRPVVESLTDAIGWFRAQGWLPGPS
jgi:dihydroflavonol-4-reductase